MKLIKRIVNKIYCLFFNSFQVNEKAYLKYYNGTKAYLRKSTSDFSVFEDVFITQEYKPIIDYIHLINKNTINVLDLGANIGLTSLYIKKKVKNTRIVAIEPYRPNYHLMINNLKVNKIVDVIPLNAAVWSSSTQLETFNPHDDYGLWGFQMKNLEDKNNAVDTFTIPQIKNIAGMETIDIIKIDIEGSEFEIFKEKSNLELIMAAKIIAIEIHPNLGDKNEILTFFDLSYHQINIQNTYFFIKKD